MPLDGNAENDLKTLAADFREAADRVKSTAETHASEIRNLGSATAETKEKADRALLEMNGLGDRLKHVEQQLARRGKEDDAGPAATKSAGEQVTESDAFKSFTDNGARGTVRMELKAITSVGGSAGELIQPDRQAGILPLARRRLTIRDLLAPGRTTSNSIEFIRQTGFTNNAAVVAETTMKPESALTLAPMTTPVRTIAHWIHVSRQAMDDAAQLRSLIDADLRYGLDAAEERELLTGDGTGQHLNGLITQATDYVAAFTPAMAQRVDTLRLAMLQATLAEYPATGIVMHPQDWAAIELLKEGTTGAYLLADPRASNGPRIWGLPVVETAAIDVDSFLVGSFARAAQIFDRMGTEVLISSEDRSNFVTNMLTVRAEKRLALAVKVPEALIFGDFGAVA